MPDTDVQTPNGGFNSFLANMDAAIKKHVPADPEGAAKITKESDDIKNQEDKIAFPTAPPEKKNTDPLQVMGSSGGWIAMLGSMLTRHPLTSALNASAAAINATKAGDQRAYDDAMTKWKANDQLIKDQQEWILNKLKTAKTDEELKLQAQALGMPGVDTIFRMPGGAKQFIQLYEKNWKDYEKHSKEVQTSLSDKMEKAAYVRDSMEQWSKDHPGATKIEQDKARLGFQSEASNIAKGDSVSKDSIDWSSLKPEDIVPGTNSTYAEIKQKAEARHNGSSYSDLGLSTRTTKNPEKAAVDNLRAKMFPDDDLASIGLEYGLKKHEASSLGTQESRLKLSDNLLGNSIPSMIEAANKLGLNSSVDWNSLVNEAKRRFSSEDFKNFQTQLRAVASDYAQFIGRGRQTVHSDEEALKILSSSEGTSSLKGFSDAVNIERKNVEKGMKDSEDNILGKSVKKDKAGTVGKSDNLPITKTLKNGTVAYKHSDGHWYDGPE